MAKKHSSKTATQEALQAANPKIQVFDKWAGVNFKDAPLGWEVEEPSTKFYQHHQTDLPFNNFLIQNNMVTDMSDSVSTRFDSEVLWTAPVETVGGIEINWEFTGVAYLYRHWLFAACHDPRDPGDHSSFYALFVHDISDADPTSYSKLECRVLKPGNQYESSTPKIHEIGVYENKLIVLGNSPVDGASRRIVFLCDIRYDEENDKMYINNSLNYSGQNVDSQCYIEDPSDAPRLTPVGFKQDEYYIPSGPNDRPPAGHKAIMRYTFRYAYTNLWGSTNLSTKSSTIYVSENAFTFTSGRYIRIEGDQPVGEGVNGVDVWVNENEHQEYTLATHIVTKSTSSEWSANWYGAMENPDIDLQASRFYPQENSTYGPSAQHFTNIDSRLYWWGDPERPYRLLVGGDIGSELSIARSKGGGWVDIEPGTGFVIRGVCKWKTASGANIVTMLCGHPNTNQVKRFNLVEMTSTFTNQIQVKGWEYEEVSNVVGCNSRWGYGVFADGLYSVARYGLMLTTMAMEYNNQMRNQKVSEVIDPIFTERLGHRLNDARLVHIDGIIYLILSEEHEDDPQSLDNVILCYDTGKKTWYTFTHREPRIVNPVTGDEVWEKKPLLHAMAIDSERCIEGLGVISKDAVTLYPTTGIQAVSQPEFDIMLETGELCARVPMQAPYYVEQLEFRFDYFIGDAECEIEGVDYYGRKFKIYKKFGKGNGTGSDPEDIEKRTYVEWVRVQKLVEFFRIRIKGKCRCRLTHIICKAYLYNNLIGTPYGFDAQDTFINRHGDPEPIHHYIDSYNNLRRAIVT